MAPLLIALLGFFTIAGLGLAFAMPGESRAKTNKRVQIVTGQAGTRQNNRRLARTANNQEDRRRQIMRSIRAQELTKASLDPSDLITRAGLTVSSRIFWIASGAVGAVLALVCLLAGLSPLICLGIGFIAAAGIPRWVLNMLAQRRLKQFTAAFADALDIIVRGIKSGLPVHDSLRIVGEECPEPLSGEFRRMLENISVGMTMEQTLEKSFERMPTSELKFFAIVLTIQAKTGGNLAEALNNLSVVLRSRKMMREKIKALSSEAIASSFIIGSLPPGVVALISVTSPAYMTTMFTDPRGHIMLAGAAIWMGLGIFVMRKMINFKI